MESGEPVGINAPSLSHLRGLARCSSASASSTIQVSISSVWSGSSSSSDASSTKTNRSSSAAPTLWTTYLEIWKAPKDGSIAPEVICDATWRTSVHRALGLRGSSKPSSSRTRQKRSSICRQVASRAADAPRIREVPGCPGHEVERLRPVQADLRAAGLRWRISEPLLQAGPWFPNSHPASTAERALIDPKDTWTCRCHSDHTAPIRRFRSKAPIRF